MSDYYSEYGCLPGRDVEWEFALVDGMLPMEIPAKVMMWESGREVPVESVVQGCSTSVSSGVFGLVIENGDEYKKQLGETELDIPSSYAEFEDGFETYVSDSLSEFDSDMVITPSRLEQGIRLATGGGEFDSESVTVTACGPYPFLIETGEEMYMVALEERFE